MIMKCKHCKTDLAQDDKFCSNCGSAVETASKRSFVLPAVIVIAAAALAGGIAVMKSGSGSGTTDISKVVYFKEESMMLAELKKNSEPTELTDSYKEEDAADLSMRALHQNHITKDGKYLYYIEDYDGFTFDLFKMPVSEPDNSKRIDANVENFNILENGNVIYEKKDSYYYHSGSEKKKFGKDVRNYRLDEDEKAMVWEQKKNYADNSDLYYQVLDQKQEKVKLESSVEQYYTAKNLKQLYTLKNGTVSKIDSTGKKLKLVSKVKKLVSFNPDEGTFYFLREGQQKMKAEDIVYADKGQTIKESFSKSKVTIPVSELYYYNGSEEILISERMLELDEYNSRDGAFCIFTELGELQIPYSKLDSSHVGNGYLPEEEINKYIAKNQSVRNPRMVIREVSFDLDQQLVWFDYVSYEPEYETLYALSGKDRDDNELTLYKVPLTGAQTGTFTEVDSDVSSILHINEKGVYYLKDYEDHNGDLYFNGEYIIPDVFHTFPVKKANLLVCVTDYDEKLNSGTIMTYDGKTVASIADDVYEVEAAIDGSLIMLADYNTNRNEGELLYYNGKEIRLLDDDVTAFARRWGSNYSWYLYYYRIMGN